MSKINFKTVLLNSLFIALCIGFNGCARIDWPVVLPEKESKDPVVVNRVIKIVEIRDETHNTVDANSAPIASQESVAPASEEDLKLANQRYYEAVNSLNTGNAALMTEVWSHAADVTYTDLDGHMKVGWAGVEEVISQKAANKSGEQISTENFVYNIKSAVAYTGCIEHILQNNAPDIERQATNIYRTEGGKWKLVHHHSRAMISAGSSADNEASKAAADANSKPEEEQPK